MKFIFNLILKPIKFLIKLLLLLIGLFAVLQTIYIKLTKSGIIKSEWIVEKTPSGKGMRFVMSVLDKIFISFQI